jgi:hypothetical protein
MQFQRLLPTAVSSIPSLEGRHCARGNSDMETLSAKQAGIDGQRARSQKYEGCTLRRQEDGALRVSGACENDPYLTQRYNHAGNRRPQTDEQKNTCDGSDYLQRNLFTLRRPHPSANVIVGQNRYNT